MTRTRVLIVDDSLTIRRRLAEIIEREPSLELIGEARDGKEAIELCIRTRPDVISMDMMLPMMTGLAATEYIMAHCPTPILIVSSSVNRGELFHTYDALAAGAVDVLEKPTGDEPEGAWEARYISALKLVAKIRVITHPRGRLTPAPLPMQDSARPAPARAPAGDYRVVAIGASTGGPGAIVEILKALPADFQIPILFVLHINEPFGAAFADWLDAQTPRRVSHAVDGESVTAAAGRVIMAPGNQHLIVQHGRLRLTRDPERHSCRPSVDVLFESVAREYADTAAACLLTGMGRDGAAGLLEIRKAGGFTIAQDEATSTIYGMPREAALLGAASRVLPLAEIGRVIGSITSGPRSRRLS
jgi:two-component system chemotaxis response regulator CheB